MTLRGKIRNIRRHVEAVVGSRKPRVISFGIPRSGSTLIWQTLRVILAELSEKHGIKDIVKTHDFTFDRRRDRFVVITYRDFRDVWVSRVLKAWGEERAISAGKDEESLRAQINNVKKAVKIMEAYRQEPLAKILWLRYEDFFGNFPYIFEELERYFGITIPGEKKKRIQAEHNLEANARIANSMPEERKENGAFRDVLDRKTQLHGRHIYDGKMGKWRKYIDRTQYALVNDLIGEELKKYGYELC